MLRDVENMFWDGSLTKLIAAFVVMISILYALYVEVYLKRLTHRKTSLDKNLNQR
jgi:hypothetical protein